MQSLLLAFVTCYSNQHILRYVGEVFRQCLGNDYWRATEVSEPLSGQSRFAMYMYVYIVCMSFL